MSLTVKDLRDLLDGLPDDMLVVLSKDAEGNGYSPLEEAEQAMYLPESSWAGERYPTPEELARLVLVDPEFVENEAPEDSVRVLLLGPVN